MSFRIKEIIKTALIGCIILIYISLSVSAAELPGKTCNLNEPYIEWSLPYSDFDSNPYDVIAYAVFTHEETGEIKRSLMFYDGQDTWKFRFTGTKPGHWTFKTEGPGTLDGYFGSVSVRKNSTTNNGFLVSKNIWSNLRPGNNSGSSPYDNNASITLEGVTEYVNIKDQIKTYQVFWFEKKRYSTEYVRDNDLTDNETGAQFLFVDPIKTYPISVCLRDKKYQHYIFYSEQIAEVRMNLSSSGLHLPAVAIDTKLPYKEIRIGKLDNAEQVWKAPYKSNWVVAVGKFPDR